MPNAIANPPLPRNEPVRDYEPGSPERAAIKERLADMMIEEVEIPLIIGGEEVRTGNTAQVICPHDRKHVLGVYHRAGESEVNDAVEASQRAWREWSEMAWEDRAGVLLKAADLLAGPWRDTVNAATMLNQSKSVYQAEIDSACELIDFWRFNPAFMRRIYEDQPDSAAGVWNRVDYRPLEGFVFAVTPFNFTSIAGNLPTAPALMGNTVLWKPASTSVLSGYYVMRVLEAAGMPAGVINFLPGSGSQVGDPALASSHFSGLHFTGSTAVFQGMWRTISERLADYKTYPRIVGETGGKDFVFVHESADVQAVVTALVRGAFEYQGQKCSAASRAYIPLSMWSELRDRLETEVGRIKTGSPLDFSNFMCAVIDESSYDNIMEYLDHTRTAPDLEVLLGGSGDKSEGFFVEPTVVMSRDAGSRLMCEEIFGPVLSIHVYPDHELEETLEICDQTSPYGLTGAIFAQDRKVIEAMSNALRHSAGNFYINDKPTGAVVGQQPFGGARASGTNDKAGSAANLLRWTSQRSIKETFSPPTDFGYPFMGAD
ncbi:MAG: L-glutamate gamma-semialdehyde dehydrogenase [bacterium]|nr:L-glutamate gamma-semialdehyde dehydrogenase [bacterium]